LSWLRETALAELPKTISPTLEEVAVSVLFAEWILYPCNSGTNPGYMHFVPSLYHYEPPGSMLRLAVEGLAFANAQRFTHSQRSALLDMARVKYGSSLVLLRSTIGQKAFDLDDSTLAAILTIDLFELMFLHRGEPLGPHHIVLANLLKLRGHQQFWSSHGISLWRIAHHRLQMRQLILDQDPLPESSQWIEYLDLSDPSFHIASDNLQVQRVCCRYRHLIEVQSYSQQDINDLSNSFQALFESMEAWKSNVASEWQARSSPVGREIQQLSSTWNLPPAWRPRFYHDVWVSYEWCFHDIGQIILREKFIDSMYLVGSASTYGENTETQITQQIDAIEEVSRRLLETLAGMLEIVRQQEVRLPGTMSSERLGLFFSLSACWVLQRGKYVALEKKILAQNMLAWIRSRSPMPGPSSQ